MAGRLTPNQVQAMRMLQARRQQYPDQPWDGATVSDRTWPDSRRLDSRVEWPAFINWRTGQALQRRGLVTYEYIGPEEGATLTLTDAGVAWPDTDGGDTDG